MNDCIFCKIINKEIPTKTLYEDDMVTAFYDINPLADIHFLVVPKCHIKSADIIDNTNSKYISHVFETIPKIAAMLDITDNYQIINNCGEKAGQSVMHLHFHVLSNK